MPAPALDGGHRDLGCHVVVTGGASGIGRAVAQAFASGDGRWEVTVADISSPSGSFDARYVRLDVTDENDWSRVVAGLSEQRNLRHAVLCAGVATDYDRIATTSPEQMRRAVEVNVLGIAFALRHLIPLVGRNGGGSVVAVASLAGLVGLPVDPVYAATKHAVVGLIRSLSAEAATSGVNVVAICPGIVDTPMISAGARKVLEAGGFPLIDPAELAQWIVDLVLEPPTYRPVWLYQAGREPAPVDPVHVPGALPAGAERSTALPPGFRL